MKVDLTFEEAAVLQRAAEAVAEQLLPDPAGFAADRVAQKLRDALKSQGGQEAAGGRWLMPNRATRRAKR